MIQGLIALITSGVLLNPMVILGIAGGVYIMQSFTESEIIELFRNSDFYLGMFAIAFLFAFFFEKVYHKDRKSINWSAIFGVTFGRFVSLFIAVVFTCLFIFCFTFKDITEDKKQNNDVTMKEKPRQEQLNEIIFK